MQFANLKNYVNPKNINWKALKSFDWRSLKKYTSPQVADDVNTFLERLPQNTSQTVLIIAGIAWACAGVLGLYTTVQIQKLTDLRVKLQEAEAVQPAVPEIRDIPINKEEVAQFVDKISKLYTGLSIKANGSSIVITADNTAVFGQFREAVGHVQNGGAGWRVAVDRLCVGRECGREALAASLKINKVSVSPPGQK